MQRNRGKQQNGKDIKKIRDTNGTFHAKMGSIKDRNGMDLTEAEDIKKRWQEYTEKLYIFKVYGLNFDIYTYGAITTIKTLKKKNFFLSSTTRTA